MAMSQIFRIGRMSILALGGAGASFYGLSFSPVARRFWLGATSRTHLEQAEETLLDLVPHGVYDRAQVSIGPELSINTIRFRNRHTHPHSDSARPSSSPGLTSEGTSVDHPPSSMADSDTPLVICPGYASGPGMYYRNYSSLLQSFRTVLAIDWLGWGLSSRPNFACEDVASSEGFFVESLEAWRRAQGMDKMVLMGHSFGGYMAAVYALRYPQHVHHLLLVSPAGVPNADDISGLYLPNRSLASSVFLNLVKFFFHFSITPQSVVRTLGPYGRQRVERYVTARFDQPDIAPHHQSITDYMFHLAAALPPSGEYALNKVLFLSDEGQRIKLLAKAPLADRLADLQVPCAFIYGESDWMDPAAGHVVFSRLAQRHHPHSLRSVSSSPSSSSSLSSPSSTPSPASAGPPRPRALSFHIVSDSGHNLFLDNPGGFYRAVQQALAYARGHS